MTAKHKHQGAWEWVPNGQGELGSSLWFRCKICSKVLQPPNWNVVVRRKKGRALE